MSQDALERDLLEQDVRACEEHCAELERELAEARAQLARAVPLEDLLELLERCEQTAARAPAGANVTSDVLDLLAWFCAARHGAADGKPVERRPNWQCSGCGWGFDGAWKKTCPCCDREDYWTGSVYPKAQRWDGSRGTSVKHDGGG